MPGNGPQRPPSVTTAINLLNGSPVYLGTIVSSGTAASNLTTATPFYAYPLQPAITMVGGQNMVGSLAGKVLLVQSSAAGFILPSPSNAITIANQNVPVPQGLSPGVLIPGSTGQIVEMNSVFGWLQWLPVSGAANLTVWELV
jgi:hypothetical protein